MPIAPVETRSRAVQPAAAEESTSSDRCTRKTANCSRIDRALDEYDRFTQTIQKS